MAGHSKWANTKHRKERADHKKGKIFSRTIKELISAVKMGGAGSEIECSFTYDHSESQGPEYS